MLSKSMMPGLRNWATRPGMLASQLNMQQNFSTLNLHSSQKQISVRIGKVKRNFFGFIIIVPENYAIMVHRLKRFHKQLEPGINFVIPFFDTVEFVHDLREQAFEISSQVAVTKDNVQLKIDGVLYVQVVDPYAASYGVERYLDAVQNLA